MSRRKILSILLLAIGLVTPFVGHQTVSALISPTWIVRPIGSEVNYRPIAVTTSDGGSVAYVVRDSLPTNDPIWTSRDSGMTWAAIAGSPTAQWGDVKTSSDGEMVVAVGLVEMGLIDNGVVWQSHDAGATWVNKFDEPSMTYTHVSMSSSGSVILLSSSSGLMLSVNSGDSFETLTPTDCGVVSVSGDGLSLFAECGDELTTSTDNGVSWSTMTVDAYDHVWTSIDSSDDGRTLLVVGSLKDYNPGAYWTSNAGANWNAVTSFNASYIEDEYSQGSMSRDGTTMVVSRYGAKPWYSTNSGVSWTEATINNPIGVTDFALSEQGDFIYSAVEDIGVVVRRSPLPTVTGINVATDTPNGGSTFTLNGTNLDGMTTVTFGGTRGTVVGTTSTTATVVSPRHIPGVVDIVLSGPLGTVVLEDGFTFSNISGGSISATSGSTLGGTRILVSGNFYGAEITSVRFGGVEAAAIVPVDESSFTVITPAHEAGRVDIEVTSDFGVRNFPNVFTFVVPTQPSLDAIAMNNLAIVDLQAGAMGILGKTTRITYSGFLPYEWVEISIASTPRLLASAQADAEGAISVEITLPEDLVGEHTLSVFAPISERGGKQMITLVPAPVVDQILGSLPATGGNTTVFPSPEVDQILGSLPATGGNTTVLSWATLLLVAGLLIKRRGASNFQNR
jgi:hypothetical protein